MQNDYFKEKEEAWAIFKEEAAKIDVETRISVLAFNIFNDAYTEYTNLCKEIENAKIVWDDYNKLTEENKKKISELYKQSAQEHSQMCENYALSNKAKAEKKGFLADKHSKIGMEHQEKRDQINEEIAELKRQIFEAKKKAKTETKYVEPAVLEDAKGLMEHWKQKYHEQEEKLASIKKKCEILEGEAMKAQEKYEQEKAHFENNTLVNKKHEKEPTLYDELRKEYEKILAEDAEIMRILEECNKKEARFRKESNNFKKKIKRVWSLARASAK